MSWGWWGQLVSVCSVTFVPPILNISGVSSVDLFLDFMLYQDFRNVPRFCHLCDFVFPPCVDFDLQKNVCAETLLQNINLYEVCSTPWAVSPGPGSVLNKVERCSTHPTKQQPVTVVGRRYAVPSNIVVLRRRRIENKNVFLLSLLKILCCGGAVLYKTVCDVVLLRQKHDFLPRHCQQL